jgi:transcriptional regulator with XRE-family HTH domain
MAKRAAKKQRAEARAPLVGDPIIARNLRAALDHAGMSPADLAGRLKLSRQATSQWLNTQTTPGAKRLRQIAGVLKVPLDVLRQAPVAQPPPKPVSLPLPKTAAQLSKRDRTVHIRPYRLGVASDQSTPANEEPLPAHLFSGLMSDEPDLVFMRVTGTDLEPTLKPGELVGADRNWNVVSVAGIYLTGDRSFPVLRRCELITGPEGRVRIREYGGEREMATNDLPIFGRVICKWLLPL